MSGLSLRPYQLDDLEALRAAFRKGARSVCYQLPTGGGKTVVAGEIARRLAALKKSVLVLVHRRELLDQFAATLMSVGIMDFGFICAGYTSTPWSAFQLASVQTLVRRELKTLNPDMIIIDEAHHARAETWEAILKKYPKAHILGLTATPERLDGKPLSRLFDVLVSGPTITELVDLGHLAPTRLFSVPEGALDMRGLDTSGHEYRQKQLDERVSKKVVAGGVYAYMKHARGKKAIFFGVSVSHAKRIASELTEAGITAHFVDGTTKRDLRASIMLDFAKGSTMVICNCDIISEGYDAPACEVVILGRPTQSVVRYLQQCGRVMRPRPGKVAMILDLCDNAGRHGLPGDERTWSLDGKILADYKKSRAAQAPVRVCEACAFIMPAGCAVCANCGRTQRVLADIEEVDTELVEVLPAHHRSQSERARQSRAIMRQAFEAKGNLKTLRALAKKSGYKPGWAYIMQKKFGGRKPFSISPGRHR